MADELITKKITEVQNFTNGDLGTIIQVQGDEIGQTNVSTLKQDITNSVVSELTGTGGVSLNLINPIGVVPTYADLALITPTPELNDAYQVEADGLVYVYTEDGFQADGDGFVVQPQPTGVVEEGNTQAVSGGEVYGEVKKPIESGLEFFKQNENLISKNDTDYNLDTLLLSAGHTTARSGYRTIKEPLVLPKGVYETNLNLSLAYLVILDADFNVISEYKDETGVWSFNLENDFNLVYYSISDAALSSAYLISQADFVNSNKDGLIPSKVDVVKERQKNDIILTNKNNNGNFVGAFRWTVGEDFEEASVVDDVFKFKGVGIPDSNMTQIQRTFNTGLGKHCLVSIVAKSSNDAILYYGRGGVGETKSAQLTNEFQRFTSILTFESTRIKFGGSVDGDIEVQSISVIDLDADLGDTLIPNEDYYSEIMKHTGYFEWKKVVGSKFLRYVTDLLINKSDEDESVEAVAFTGNNEVNLRIKEFFLYESVDNLQFTRLYAQSNVVRVFVKTIGSPTSSDYIQLGFTNADENIYGKVLTLYRNNNPQVAGYIVLEYEGNADYFFDSNTTILPSVNDIENSPKIKEYLNREEQLVLLSSSTFGYKSENVLKEFLISKIDAKIYNCGFSGCRMAWRTPDGTSDYDAFCAVEIADALATQDFTKQLNANTNLGGDFDDRLADLMQIDLTKPTTIFVKYIDNDITGASLVGDLWEFTDTLPNYDKTTFLGAMNYLVERLSTVYPHIKWVFFSDSWRYKNDKFGNSVPPYAFVNSADINGMTYMEKEEENCKRMGLSFFDFMTYGIQNPYNNSYFFVDQTHFNYFGYIYLSDKLTSVYNSAMK